MMYEELIKSLRKEAEDTYHFIPKILCLQAADAIEELTMKLHGDEAAIAGMKQQIERMVVNSGNKPKWIPVTERLPEVGQKVFFSYRGCIKKRPRIFIGWYNGKQWDSLFATEYDVTHWMPKPEPPKEETDG